MNKAKLIKQGEIAQRDQEKTMKQAQKNNVQKTVRAVVEWVENQRNQKEDPRKAFAALFAQP
ncbi:MAG TPA: hypothetical protein PLD20_05935 [Blastocatellia bacterium]|nr:hypothetical protein [Blastocatellia bacterium]HMY70844.1 hypothetical protein [Blastocatellia bacterium]HMZ17447.1 hypothetical protein [Blastocatellia bacterium]HNG28769.1 hypothetical protein [Blastocatellia bacterium]